MPFHFRRLAQALALRLLVAPLAGQAAEIAGRALNAWWGRPFAGLLLSIALFPLLAAGFWHHHIGKVAEFSGGRGSKCLRREIDAMPGIRTDPVANERRQPRQVSDSPCQPSIFRRVIDRDWQRFSQ